MPDWVASLHAYHLLVYIVTGLGGFGWRGPGGV